MAKDSLKTRIEELEDYFEKNLLTLEKEFMNEIKRTIYQKIQDSKKAGNEEEAKNWAEYYEELKNM